MSFNKKYLEQVLAKRYGFTVEKDGTGLAYHAFLTNGEDCTSLSGPWSERESALQCGILKLMEKIQTGKVKAREAA